MAEPPSTVTSGAYHSLVRQELFLDRVCRGPSDNFNYLMDVRQAPSAEDENLNAMPGVPNFNYHEEDEFGYSQYNLREKYKHLGNEIILATVEKSWNYGLGISLCGHKNQMIKKVFINDLHPLGPACDCDIRIADQILEVNGVDFEGVDFTEAAWTIKLMKAKVYKIILLRRVTASFDMFIKDVNYFPTTEFDLDNYMSQVRNVRLTKINDMIGFAVDEDYDEEAGWVHRITAVESFSAAERANISVGETIVFINDESVINKSHLEVRELISSADGEIELVICNLEAGKDIIRVQKKIERENRLNLRKYQYIHPKTEKKLCSRPSPSKEVECVPQARVYHELMEVDANVFPSYENISDAGADDDAATTTTNTTETTDQTLDSEETEETDEAEETEENEETEEEE